MAEPRAKGYCHYTQATYAMMGLLKNVCGQKSMRSMEENFNTENVLTALQIISADASLQEIPCADSLNYYLSKLQPQELSNVRCKMIRHLIRSRTFDNFRFLEKYWPVVLDGTGVHAFSERHCEHDLVCRRKLRDGKEQTIYYHKILEAKLVVGPLVLSIGTEFIENEDKHVTKQDCEQRAAKRLMERLKKEYPRLPVCLQGDGLYATEPVMRKCREYGWQYIFTLKDKRPKELAQNYAALRALHACEEKTDFGPEHGIGCYANHMEELCQKDEIANVFSYEYRLKKKKEEKLVKFCWLSNLEINDRNLSAMIEEGRKRWKIENEGFNRQKNGIYDIEHLNSHNSCALKNHYLLTQIAEILMQLYLSWNPYARKLKQSIKNTSSKLLVSLTEHSISSEDVKYIEMHTKIHLSG